MCKKACLLGELIQIIVRVVDALFGELHGEDVADFVKGEDLLRIIGTAYGMVAIEGIDLVVEGA
jgi:hypothetical protein